MRGAAKPGPDRQAQGNQFQREQGWQEGSRGYWAGSAGLRERKERRDPQERRERGRERDRQTEKERQQEERQGRWNRFTRRVRKRKMRREIGTKKK